MSAITKRGHSRAQLAHLESATGVAFNPQTSRDYRRKQARRLRKQAQEPKQDKPSKGFQ
jgi:hypothetical protein